MINSSLQRYVGVTSTHNDREKCRNSDHSFPCSVVQAFTWSEVVVYILVLGSIHTEYVREEPSSESKREVDGKTPKPQPMKIDSWSSWHSWSRFVVWQNSKVEAKQNKTKMLKQLIYSKAVWWKETFSLNRMRKERCNTSKEREVLLWDKLKITCFVYFSIFDRPVKTDHARFEMERNHYKRSFIQIKWRCEHHSCSGMKKNSGLECPWIKEHPALELDRYWRLCKLHPPDFVTFLLIYKKIERKNISYHPKIQMFRTKVTSCNSLTLLIVSCTWTLLSAKNSAHA